jgi:chemotaxis response regulator CheB
VAPQADRPREPAWFAGGFPLAIGAAAQGMANRDVVAIGTSAGGVEALIFLAKQLRREFPACVLVMIHLPSHTRSSLDELRGLAGRLPVRFCGRRRGAQKGSHLCCAAQSASAPQRRPRVAGGGRAREQFPPGYR